MKANLESTLQIQLCSNDTNSGFLTAIVLYIRTVGVDRGMFLLDVYCEVCCEHERRLVGVDDQIKVVTDESKS